MTRAPIAFRRGSLVVMAILFLVILAIIIFAFQWSSFSTHKMFHHTYYSERAICLLDGLAAIARGVVQLHLDPIIENLRVGDPPSDLKPYIPGGLTAAVKAKAEMLKLFDSDDADAKRAIVPEIKLTVRLLAKDDFKSQNKTVIHDEKEKVGKLEISIEVAFKGFRDVNFQATKKTAKTQFEFKKLRAVPPFFRHFSVYVKNGIPKPEKEEDYADSAANFNHLVSDRTGNNAISGGALFVQNGTVGLPQGHLPKVSSKKRDNPFYGSVPYIYIGGANRAYLNLAAGGGGNEESSEESIFGEDFQLYRGQSTHFYRVVATEFSNFVENAPSGISLEGFGGSLAGGGFLRWLRDTIKTSIAKIGDVVRRALQFFRALDDLEKQAGAGPSTNLPLYYIVRKDFGYASEWGENPSYKKYGFGSGRVVSNSLHLYNSRSSGAKPTPTVVLGNVYRRCLSLSGYKQRRSLDNPSLDRKFEVQAGPIDYYKSMDDLFSRTLDWSKNDEAGGPIWVWDMRVDWSKKEDLEQGKDVADGTYIPVSGASLFGRLVPGLQRLWNADRAVAEKLFAVALAPPARLFGDRSGRDGDSSGTLNTTDPEEGEEGGMSPIFTLFNQCGGFQLATPSAEALKLVESGTIFGELGSKENSAYFEELFRNFCYVCSGVPDSLLAKYGPSARETIGKAGALWRDLLSARLDHPLLATKLVPMDPNTIPDSRKKSRWVGGNSTGDGLIYPWSLPDPWSDRGSQRAKNNFESVLKSVSNPQKLFDQYFKPLMTNPGRTLPYNYSLRFWFSQFKEIFSLSSQERSNLMSREVVPELRDAAFGYIEGAGNDYLKPKAGESVDPALSDEVLAQIHQRRVGGDEYLRKGWFFMDDYGKAVKSPKDVDLEEIFVGDHYCYEEMDQAQFEERFVKVEMGPTGEERVVALGTVVKVKDLSLGPVTIRGGGAILSDKTPIKITGSIKSVGGGPPLILKAPSFEISANTEVIDASIVATREFKFKGARDCRIRGNLVAQAWDPESWTSPTGSQRRIVFDPALKSTPDTPPYILNLEPRIRKYVIEASQ